MLHMILAILKLIGILLAVVVVLLLLVFLLVLFAPVRYELSGDRFSHAEGSMEVSWLLGVICFRLSLGRKGVLARVRLLGFQRQVFPEENQAAKRRRGKKAPPEKRVYRKEKTAEEKRTAGQEKSENNWKQPEKESGSQKVQKVEKKERAVDSEEKKSREKTWFPVRWIRSFSETIKKIFRRIQASWRKLLGIGKNMQRAKFYVRHWSRLLTSDLAKGLVKRYKGYLFYLLKHIRPRRVRGSLQFGLGDPALTGQLTGILYLLLPASCGKLEILPDFGACRLEGQVDCKGHIRLCHFAYVGWKVFRDKELRRLIQKVKHKEE